MRVLFTTLAMAGHFQPLAPIARACAASFAPVVERAGFPALPAGFDTRGCPFPAMFPGIPPARPWTEVFVPILAGAMTPDLLTIAGEWRPDLVVREAMEYGGCLAAE